jgi:hypothetical protein
MILNVDTKRFLSTITEIPDHTMVTDFNKYIEDNGCITDSFTSFAMTTLEHVSSNGMLMYGGMIYINGWGAGRPAKRRLNPRQRKAMVGHTFNKVKCEAVRLFETLLSDDPDKECVWAVLCM